jgi:hypothetical protein
MLQCTDYIQNGNFESGSLDPWIVDGSGRHCHWVINKANSNEGLIHIEQDPIQGAFDAAVYQYGRSVFRMCSLKQTVDLGVTFGCVKSATLAFKYRINSNAELQDPKQQARVSLDNGGGLEEFWSTQTGQSRHQGINTETPRSHIADVTASMSFSKNKMKLIYSTCISTKSR